MKRKLEKSFVVSLITLLTLSMFLTVNMFMTIPVFATGYNPLADIQDGNATIYLEQSTYHFTTENVSSPFYVDVIGYNISEVFAYQVVIAYNASQLECLNAWPDGGGWTDPDWAFYGLPTWGTAWGSYTDQPSAGLNAELVGDSLKNTEDNVTVFEAETLLARFEFNITMEPPRYGNVSCTLQLDSTVASGTFVQTPTDSSNLKKRSPWLIDSEYLYEWVAPSPPWLEVDPGLPMTIDYGPNYAIGEEFNISIWIKNVDEEHWLWNATFDLTYNSTLLEVLGVYEGPFFGTYGTNIFTPSIVPGTVHVTQELTSLSNGYPDGDGIIAKIEFNITFQHDMGELPDPRECFLNLTNIELTASDDASIEVDEGKVVDGKYRIFAFVAIWDTWFEVQFSPSHEITLGPDYMIGQTFDAIITINNTRGTLQRMIAYQFVLDYPEDILECVDITQGPFMSQFNSTALGTLFMGFCDIDGEAIVGELIYPNVTGSTAEWYYFPEGDGVVATITFKIIHQSPDPFSSTSILGFLNENRTYAVNDSEEKILFDQSLMVNGTVTILGWSLEGRKIDVYAGMYEVPYPTPYGGQGLMQDSDMFWPQKQVWLWANVTYNWWPEQNKIVTFEIYSPLGYFTTLTAVTDENGVAVVSFRIPWPCDEPDSLFGVWTVYASVDIASQVVTDRLRFHYDWLVNIWDVTPDRPPGPCSYYKHCDWIEITVNYGSYAMQTYDVKIVVVVTDEVNVPIGTITLETTVGGAEWCSYNNATDIVEIHVVKWAHAGYATIHANVFAWNPYRQEWFAAGPEALATILIQPEWA